MRVFDLDKVQRESAGVMAFGFFDCIHLGHQKVISSAVALADKLGVPSSVFLFRNNIFPIIGIEKYPVFNFEERLAFIRNLKVDRVFYAEADRSFLSRTPEEFAAYLKNKLDIKGFTCGRDFSFGARGLGTPSDLIATLGGEYKVLDLSCLDGEKIGTEAVKRALLAGDLPQVEKLLGRRFSLFRTVESGRSDGRKMGFPTINSELGTLSIKEGVYFSNVYLDGVRYAAVTNVGTHPTFSDHRANLETHLLDYRGDLYGREVWIEFLQYRREIRKFDSLERLIETIGEDVKARREYD